MQRVKRDDEENKVLIWLEGKNRFQFFFLENRQKNLRWKKRER